MKGLAGRAEALAPLQRFNSDVFREATEVPQDLCDLMLGFALAFNDCRDLALWSDDLLAGNPDARRLNRYQGEQGGQLFHCLRLIVGAIHELGELIRKNSSVLNHPYFKDILDRLPPEAREKWERMRDIAHGRGAGKARDELLKALRDTVVFHYDKEDLGAAFDRRFPSGATDKNLEPLFSLGRRVESVRFYFADAAVTKVLEQEVQRMGLAPFGPPLSQMLKDVTLTLAVLVQGFIEARTAPVPIVEEPGPPGSVDALQEP